MKATRYRVSNATAAYCYTRVPSRQPLENDA